MSALRSLANCAAWSLLGWCGACAPSQPGAGGPPSLAAFESGAAQPEHAQDEHRRPPQVGGFEVLEPADPVHPFALELGRLEAGAKVQRRLRLLNREGRALTVRSLQAGCSCTGTVLRVLGGGGSVQAEGSGPGLNLSVPKGGEAELFLEISAALSPTKNSPKLVLVRLTSDSERAPYQTFEVRFLVHEPISASPATIWMQNVPQSFGGTGRTELSNLLNTGEIITGVAHCPEPLTASLRTDVRAGVTIWTLDVTMPAPIELGRHGFEVRLATSGPAGTGVGAPVVVPVEVQVVPDVAFRPDLMMLRRPDPGSAHEAASELAAHLPGQRFKLSAPALTGELAGKLEVLLDPFEPDEKGRASRWAVRLRALGPLGADPAVGMLRLATDDPALPVLEVRYFKNAEPNSP